MYYTEHELYTKYNVLHNKNAHVIYKNWNYILFIVDNNKQYKVYIYHTINQIKYCLEHEFIFNDNNNNIELTENKWNCKDEHLINYIKHNIKEL